MSEVVHFEPYPVVESVDILDKAGVKHFPFSGVTFNGYFRLLGGMPNANVPLKCGGIAYIEYAYQAIVCRSCGKTWSIQQYEQEK